MPKGPKSGGHYDKERFLEWWAQYMSSSPQGLHYKEPANGVGANPDAMHDWPWKTERVGTLPEGVRLENGRLSLSADAPGGSPCRPRRLRAE